MRRAFVAIGLLLLCSSAVSASPAPELASFLNSLNGGGSCPAPVQAAAKKDDPGGGVIAFSYCEANCYPFSNVSCSGATCSAVDRSCPGQRGYVQCDGVTTYCPTCGSQCNEGWQDWRDGGCCQGGYQKWQIYECIGGMWQHVDTYCDSVSCF